MDPQVTRALDVVARAPRLLVATDFDGVLAPFVLDPMDARPQAGTVESLGRLAAAEATWTAVVSGRDLATLTALTGIDSARTTLIGSHGAETSRSASGLVTPEVSARLHALRSAIEDDVSRREPRIRLEHKPTAVVLHTRGLPDEAVDAAAEIAAAAATTDGITLLSGKGVHELSVVRADKGTALTALADEIAVDAMVYLGDDVTDEHVFAVLGETDLGIKVGEGETAARLRLPDSTAVPDVLATLARLRT
ncbi:MAG TPA: trehalose-phosphatase [Candidatus Janibacter merdipullorum]|nr:trehalose-phosphatase [Candidatus Janibacter merdipullorum]